MTDSSTDNNEAPKRENIWLNIGLNVIIPSILMSKGGKWYESITGNPLEKTHWLLVIALAFPIAYGVYDFIARKKYNFFSILGFVSILITGAVGILELPKDWVAVKEAAIPLLFAIAILVSLKTPFPLVKTFLYNPDIFDVPKIESALEERQNQNAFEKLLVRCTLFLVGSNLLSAVLNYGLAKYVIRSETGTPEFTEELGKMTALSWPVIVLPTTAVMMVALFMLIKGLQKYTGYEIEDILRIDVPKDDADKTPTTPTKDDDTKEEPSDT